MLQEVLPFLAPDLRGLLRSTAVQPQELEELRLRAHRPLHLVHRRGDGFLTSDGRLTADPTRAHIVSDAELQFTFQLVARGSVYAWEEELRGGFITLPGGHRVGVCGRAIVEGGRLRSLRPVAGLNIRLARAVPGIAAGVLPLLVGPDGGVHSTLLLSPPQAGKTTLLRDLVRLISTGVAGLGLTGQKVAVVDERSELAGCIDGVPQRDLGPRTDVLDGCPKAEGMMLMIRALSPQVLAVDEIGRPEDAAAVLEALLAGVAILSTAHGRDPAELLRRPSLAQMLTAGAFRRAVRLSRRHGPGTVDQVWDLPDDWPRQAAAPLLAAESLVTPPATVAVGAR